MIDPYNSLLRDKETMMSHGAHEAYDYAVMSDMRLFTRRNKCSIYLVTHAVTEALRHRHPSNHPFANYITPPSAGVQKVGGSF